MTLKEASKYCEGCMYACKKSAFNTCDFLGIRGYRRPCKGPLHSEDGKCQAKEKAKKPAGKKRAQVGGRISPDCTKWRHKGYILIQNKKTFKYSIYQDLEHPAIFTDVAEKVLSQDAAFYRIDKFLGIKKKNYHKKKNELNRQDSVDAQPAAVGADD